MNDDPDRVLPGEACWRPEDEPEDELGFFTGVMNALGMTAIIAMMVWTAIVWFTPDEFNPPIEIEEVAP